MKEEGIQAFVIKAELHNVGLTIAQTLFVYICRFMIWSEQSVICFEVAVELKF